MIVPKPDVSRLYRPSARSRSGCHDLTILSPLHIRIDQSPPILLNRGDEDSTHSDFGLGTLLLLMGAGFYSGVTIGLVGMDEGMLEVWRRARTMV